MRSIWPEGCLPCRPTPPPIGEVDEEATMMSESETFEIEKSEAEWRKTLSPEQFRVLRRHGTERAGSSPLDKHDAAGTYACAGCGEPLFTAQAKFDSGTGWPSFTQPIKGAVATRPRRGRAVVCADARGRRRARRSAAGELRRRAGRGERRDRLLQCLGRRRADQRLYRLGGGAGAGRLRHHAASCEARRHRRG